MSVFGSPDRSMHRMYCKQRLTIKAGQMEPPLGSIPAASSQPPTTSPWNQWYRLQCGLDLPSQWYTTSRTGCISSPDPMLLYFRSFSEPLLPLLLQLLLLPLLLPHVSSAPAGGCCCPCCCCCCRCCCCCCCGCCCRHTHTHTHTHTTALW